MLFRIALLTLLASPALAGESGKAPTETPKTAAAKDPASPVQRVAFVAQLITWSRTQQSVEGHIASAQILASIPLAEYQAAKTAVPTEGVTADRDKDEAKALTLDPTALLKEAKWYASASPDKKLQAYVDSVAKRGLASAGTTGGPKYAITNVNGAFTDVYDITFTGGEAAEIAIGGDGDTDLDLYVYDEFNNYVASDTASTDNAYVTWTPRWTGKFRVEVRNEGGVHNQYVFVTN